MRITITDDDEQILSRICSAQILADLQEEFEGQEIARDWLVAELIDAAAHDIKQYYQEKTK